MQRVADENGGRLVVLHVDRGTPAAQVVVVHRRQIVVNQGVGVDQLDGGGGMVEGRFGRACQPTGGIHQPGADALAAAEHGVAHGLGETGRNLVGWGQESM